MTANILITRPEHDDTTAYLSAWCHESVKPAISKGFRIIDLHRERANKKEFESIIKDKSPKFVVLNGHGSENHVAGHKNYPLVISGENEHLLKEKIVYAISCSSAKVLGSTSIKSGALCYVGYSDEFVFVHDQDKILKPLEDKTAELFLGHSKTFIVSVIKGNSIGESYDRAKAVLKRNLNSLLSSDNPDSLLIRYLWWDLQNFTIQGSPKTELIRIFLEHV